MAKQSLSLGTNANDNTGDTLRAGGDKINDNFDEVYAALGNGTTLTVNTTNPATGQVLRYNGSTFLPSDYTNLTANLDVNGSSIISSSNGNINIATNGTGNLTLGVGGITNSFNGTTGDIDFPTKLKYKNEYASTGVAPAEADYRGIFYTVSGDDNPYVNINITAGGVGNTKAKLLTQYSGANDLVDVDTTTVAPTNNQVLKWDSTASKWKPGDDASGIASINLFATVAGDTGNTTANTQTDTLTIAGGTNITTSVAGDTVTVDFSGTLTTTFAALTDTDIAGITQGDSVFYDGSVWKPNRSPLIWFELNAVGTGDYTVSGPGFSGVVNDPTFTVYKGFTYAFDNSIQGGGHPFRIQSTQGLAGTPYTTGQSGSGTTVLYWTVPMDAPATLYYQCTLHAAMNGTIYVA